ncbi:MAG: 2,6-beta-D-fructofuranosidase [Cyclobacteriaceae bacterium]|uniref:2,6-beta-D-fructofuranosidase n=1 Tax=Imperialibacter sp. TaxID=2038411 RepID=UPI0032ED549D
MIRSIKSLIIFLLMACSFALNAQTERTFKIKLKYLNIPIQSSLERQRVDFFVDAEKLTYNDIRVAENNIDYWTFVDVSAHQGKEFKFVFSKNVDGINKIFQADTIVGETNLYKENLRPQVHYTTRRGWTNDPNGMVYYDGEYHLFYQHNPYETDWGNMTWNHAVSTDLLDWEELTPALLPDGFGTMFSGSAVIDYHNTAGFNKGDSPAMLVMYTADLRKNGEELGQQQCIAYSLDKGRTFTKYEGNPVIPMLNRFGSKHARDPKVFWYEPGNHWVMIMHEGISLTIYNSKDFKKWELTSTLNDGYWECPELFELPINGDEENKKWVVYGVRGTYQIGTFDGKVFTPETEMLRYNHIGWSMTAAQSFNDEPQGRRVSIGWGHAHFPGMPFTETFTFPMEMSLKTTPNGVRLHVEPVGEIEALHTKTHSLENLFIGDELNDKLKAIKSPMLHINTTIEADNSRFFGMNINGYELKYDIATNTLNDVFIPLQNRCLELEVIVDKTVIEVYANGGRYYWFYNYTTGDLDDFNIRFIKGGDPLHKNPKTLVKKLEIHELLSIW